MDSTSPFPRFSIRKLTFSQFSIIFLGMVKTFSKFGSWLNFAEEQEF